MQPYLFVCTECHSDQKINPEKNVWVQDNIVPPCRYCGGVCLYIEADTTDKLQKLRIDALRQSDNSRGL